MKKALLTMRLIAIAVLALAFIGGFPIGFYRFVRFVVFGVCGFLAFFCYGNERRIWMVLYAISALIFNPFLPLYLGRELWQVVDLVVGVFLVVSLIAFRVQEDKPDVGG